jgi:hypothetical protein
MFLWNWSLSGNIIPKEQMERSFYAVKITINYKDGNIISKYEIIVPF